MEVHHHSHHPKKWKEYLTEFLMLFLAVSMGFIAENIREKYVENERSNELMRTASGALPTIKITFIAINF